MLAGGVKACRAERLRRLSAWRFRSVVAVGPGRNPAVLFWRGVAAWRRSLIGLESGVEDLQLGVVRFQLAVSGFQIQDVGDAGQIHALVDQFGDPPRRSRSSSL